MLATLALGDYTRAEQDEVCYEAESCVMESGKKCDRTEKNCPPCVYESSNKYYCYELNFLNSCNWGVSYCPPTFSSASGSDDGSTTPEPTTAKPTTKPTTKAPSTDSESDSGSGSASPAPTKATPKPTTTAPATTAPATEVPTTVPPANATTASQETIVPTTVQNTSATESSSKMPLIIGVGAAAVVVIAVVAFFVWKRHRDDDEDSDDEDYKQRPKTTYNARADPGPASVATTASYNNIDVLHTRTSPTGAGAKYAAGGYGAPYGKQQPKNQYNASGNTYAYGGYGAGGVDYGSPSAIDGNNRDMYTGKGGVVYDNLGSSEDSRDVWGNTIGNTKGSRPVPTAATTQTAFREKRTLSNVSVEF